MNDSILMARDQKVKHDAGKLMLELIPVECYESLGRVLTFGAQKYGPNSWQQVDMERYVGALLRHYCLFRQDPWGVDVESGLMHTEHLLCNAMFLDYLAKRSLPLPKGE